MAVPTWLWDWSRYPTLGTLTGPRAGILVLDVDEAIQWKKAVDKNNSPLLANRWDDLADGLVSCRGEATPDRVRLGKARGKLIFRVAVGPDHWLATIKPGRWKAKYGVEVFYGHGIPSLLGAGPDGTTYRIDGTLGPPPAWLLELLQPRRHAHDRPGSPRMPSGAIPSRRPVDSASTTPRRAPEDGQEPLGESLGSLREWIAEVDPLLNGPVGWRRKDLADGRPILVGTCPYHTAAPPTCMRGGTPTVCRTSPANTSRARACRRRAVGWASCFAGGSVGRRSRVSGRRPRRSC